MLIMKPIDKKIKLGIVIITHNEECFIEKCIDSIWEATNSIEYLKTDIVVIDSLSKDDTCAIVAKKGIQIKKIPQNMPRCAGLSRWVGGHEQKDSDYILFIDGDMTLHKGFIEVAIKELKGDSQAAGLIGILDTYYYEGNSIRFQRKNIYDINSKRRALHFGGALIVKTKIYNFIGGYDPFIFAEEEAEFYSRIKRNNYHVLQIPVMMAIHHTCWVYNFNKLINLFNPFVRKNYGVGQGFIRSIIKGTIFNYIKQQQEIFLNLFFDIISVLGALYIVFSLNIYYLYFFTYLIIFQLLIAYINILKKKKLKWYIINKARYFHLLYGIIYTFFFLLFSPDRQYFYKIK